MGRNKLMKIDRLTLRDMLLLVHKKIEPTIEDDEDHKEEFTELYRITRDLLKKMKEYLKE